MNAGGNVSGESQSKLATKLVSHRIGERLTQHTTLAEDYFMPFILQIIEKFDNICKDEFVDDSDPDNWMCLLRY